MTNDLIDRQEAITALGERPMSLTDSDYELGSRNRFDMDRHAIDTVPSVDAVPVVRCKDCELLKEYVDKWRREHDTYH